MVKLLLFKEPITGIKFDSVLVVVNRLTKWGAFIPYKKLFTVEDLVYAFLCWIVAEHRLLQELIFDRDKLFTSRFWKALISQLKVKYKLLIAYYLQTDGQTERMNQTLEQYLRYFYNY